MRRDQRMGEIPRRQVAWRQRPANVESGIIKSAPSFGVRSIGCRVAVNELGVVAQGLKTVGQPLRHEQGNRVRRREMLGMPLQERGRIAAEVYDDVPDLTADARDQFHLSVWWKLKV